MEGWARVLKPSKEREPTDAVTGEPAPRGSYGRLQGLVGVPTDPAVCGGLDLVWSDELTWPISQVQCLRDDKSIAGNVEQRFGSHLLLSTVKKVAKTFLGQRAVLLPGDGV